MHEIRDFVFFRCVTTKTNSFHCEAVGTEPCGGTTAGVPCGLQESDCEWELIHDVKFHLFILKKIDQERNCAAKHIKDRRK
jgi:hypothetical protein